MGNPIIGYAYENINMHYAPTDTPCCQLMHFLIVSMPRTSYQAFYVDIYKVFSTKLSKLSNLDRAIWTKCSKLSIPNEAFQLKFFKSSISYKAI